VLLWSDRLLLLRARLPPVSELSGDLPELESLLLLLDLRPVVVAEQDVGGHSALGGVGVLLHALLAALTLLLAALLAR
jgi:hypothetical protein